MYPVHQNHKPLNLILLEFKYNLPAEPPCRYTSTTSGRAEWVRAKKWPLSGPLRWRVTIGLSAWRPIAAFEDKEKVQR